VNFEKLLELEVGDVLVLGNDEHTALTILVEGCPKLAGHPRVSGGAIALEIDHDLTPRPAASRPNAIPYVPKSAA
jgi:flagellar motor switch protein FliM